MCSFFRVCLERLLIHERFNDDAEWIISYARTRHLKSYLDNAYDVNNRTVYTVVCFT